jgi:protoporphyrinogen oxidase
MFGYVRGGYARILDRFAEVLAENGVTIETGKSVKAVRTGSVELADGETRNFDRIVITSAAPLAAKLCPDLNDVERETLQQVKYQGIVCASMLLKQPLGPYYVTNITETWVPFTAVIEMSALVDRTAFGGNSLIYLPKYVAPDDPLFDESDESIRERFLTALEKMYSHFRREDVLAFRLSRVRNIFAISTLNYSEHVPPMTTSLPGVYLVNSAHIVNGTLNVNETVQLAESAACGLASPTRCAEVAV